MKFEYGRGCRAKISYCMLLLADEAGWPSLQRVTFEKTPGRQLQISVFIVIQVQSIARIEKEAVVQRLTQAFEQSSAVFGMQYANINVSPTLSVPKALFIEPPGQ